MDDKSAPANTQTSLCVTGRRWNTDAGRLSVIHAAPTVCVSTHGCIWEPGSVHYTTRNHILLLHPHRTVCVYVCVLLHCVCVFVGVRQRGYD